MLLSLLSLQSPRPSSPRADRSALLLAAALSLSSVALPGCIGAGTGEESGSDTDAGTDTGSDTTGDTTDDYNGGPGPIDGGSLTLTVNDRDDGSLLCQHVEEFGPGASLTAHQGVFTYYSEGGETRINLTLSRDNGDTVSGAIIDYTSQAGVIDKTGLDPSSGLNLVTDDVASASYQLVCGSVANGEFSLDTVSAIYGIGQTDSYALSLSGYAGPGFGGPVFCANPDNGDCEVAEGKINISGTITGKADEGDGTGLSWTLELDLEGVHTAWTREKA